MNAAAFLCSGLALRAISAPKHETGGARSLVEEVKEGVKPFVQNPSLGSLILYYACVFLAVVGPAQVAMPLIAERQLHAGAMGFAALQAAHVAGTLCGMDGSMAWPKLRIVRLGLTIPIGIGSVGLMLSGFAFINSIAMAVPLMLLAGMVLGYVQVTVLTWIQRRIPEHLMARAMGVLSLVFFGAPPLSATLAGAMMQVYPPHLVFAGAGVLLALLSLGAASLRAIRTIEDEVAATAPA
jgi:hypothetical protein